MEEDEVEDQPGRGRRRKADFVVYLLFVDEQGMHRHSSIASIRWYDDEGDEPLMTRCIISTHHTPLHSTTPRSEEGLVTNPCYLQQLHFSLNAADARNRATERLEDGSASL